MKIVFWASDKDFDKRVSELFAKGVTAAGDEFEIRDRGLYDRPDEETDVAMFIGVKGRSNEMLRAYVNAGKHVIFVDKGHIRVPSKDPMVSVDYFRFSVDAFQPLKYFQKIKRPDDRWSRFHIDLLPMQKNGEHIVFAGSSEKYSRFMKIPEPTEYARRVFKDLKRNSLREIVYRPKPSWKNAVPVDGSMYSSRRRKLYQELVGAHALVTHGSNACLDALIRGVPTFVLGNGITKPLSRKSATQINNPYYPTDDQRYQLCSDMAYCQWNLKEMANGEAWSDLRKTILELSK